MPIPFRFPIISPKQFSSLNLFKVECRVLKNYTGINHFFIIDKNKPILDTLNQLSEKEKAKSIETFDFSTLYTMIKHDDLIDNLNWYIEKAFNGALGKGKSYLSVYDREAKWVTKPRAGSCFFDKSSFQEILKFLIDNSIFEVGNRIIKQTIGIPMGTDPGPFMANAHLHKYEFFFQEKNRKVDYGVAKSLNYTFRYIDDVTPINDKGNFCRYMNDIYPPDLVLSKENIGTYSATVLDLDINIKENKFEVSVFDKTNSFSFNVVKYPSLNSNVPDQVLYNVFYSQIIRFLNICTHESSFLTNLSKLSDTCKNKGAAFSKLKNELQKLFKNNPDLVQKLNLNLQTVLHNL